MEGWLEYQLCTSNDKFAQIHDRSMEWCKSIPLNNRCPYRTGKCIIIKLEPSPKMKCVTKNLNTQGCPEKVGLIAKPDERNEFESGSRRDLQKEKDGVVVGGQLKMN